MPIYLDNSATTRPCENAIAAMAQCMRQDYFNPSALYAPALRASAMHFIAGKAPGERFACTAKVRYRQADQPCEVSLTEDGGAVVRFEQPQRAVTPGQYVVLYKGEECLGGGVIEEALER